MIKGTMKQEEITLNLIKYTLLDFKGWIHTSTTILGEFSTSLSESNHITEQIDLIDTYPFF